MAKTVNYTIVATMESRIGKINLLVDQDAERKVAHLQFEEAFTSAGNKLALSFSDFSKGAYGIVEARPAKVMGALARTKYAGAFLKLEKLESEESKEDAIQNTLEEILIWGEANTPKSGTTQLKRDVDESFTKLLADMFLIAAGTTGELPISQAIQTKMENFIEEARKMAEKKAETLGKDSLGQFRLRKEKAAKNTSEATETSENTEDSEDSEESTEE